MKTCTKCGIPKPLSEFFKDKQKKDGHRPDCKTCNIEKSTAWQRNNKEKRYGYDIKYKYGVSLQEYQKMLKDQNNKCALCEKHIDECNTRFHVDHNHKTGKVRALLCVKCNHGIGAFMEDKKLLKEAVKYLDKYA